MREQTTVSQPNRIRSGPVDAMRCDAMWSAWMYRARVCLLCVGWLAGWLIVMLCIADMRWRAWTMRTAHHEGGGGRTEQNREMKLNPSLTQAPRRSYTAFECSRLGCVFLFNLYTSGEMTWCWRWSSSPLDTQQTWDGGEGRIKKGGKQVNEVTSIHTYSDNLLTTLISV